MSPPKDNAIVPRTPDRRSSTHALFTAFRNLTGGRLRSPTPPPSTPSVASTPTPTSSTTRLPQRIAQPVLGGPPELEGLVAQLDSGNAFPERAAAIEEICKILQTYPISNVLGLWSVASDLLLPEQPDEVAEAGYKLLKNCVSWPKLSAIERSIFFDAVFLRDKDRYFDRRLQVINILTKRGRDIDACESAIIPFIISSLDACYRASHAAQKANKAHGKHGADKPTLEAQNLAHVLQYAIDICRFNAKIFTDGDLELLLGRAVNICQRTMDPGDLENCIKLFDTVNTYVHIPKGAMGSCVEVLCTVSGLKGDNDPLKDRSWSTLKNLLQSHIGGAAVLSLLHILFRGAAPPKERPSQNALKGTYVVLRTLLLDDGHSGLPTVPMALLCPALRASMTALLQPHDGMVVGLVDIVLSHDILRDQLFGETDVGDFVDLMCICMERDAESRRGRVKGTDKSSTTAAKHVDDGTTSLEKQRAFRNGTNSVPTTCALELTSADAGSPSPSVSSSTHADDEKRLRSKTPEQSLRYADADFRSSDNPIFQVLVKLDNASDALDFVKKEALVQMFLRHPQRLGDSSVEKLIRHLAKERYLNPAHGAWLEICRNIVNGIAKDGSRPQSVRILAIQSIRKTYETVERLCATEEVAQCRALLLDHVQIEDDLEVLHELVDFAVHVADRAAFTEFSDVVRLLKARLDRPESSAITSPPHWPSQYPVLKRNAHFGSPCNIVATAFVRLFIRSVAGAASKTRTLYEVLREIAGNDRYANDARLSALKLLFRLRADARHAVTISSSSEGQRIAAELCRTADTAVAPDMADQGQPTDRGKPEESNTRTEQRKISGSSPHSSLNRNTSRTATSGRVSKPIPPLWMYPGPKGLPEEPIADPSRVVFSHIDASKYPLSDDVLDMEITLWLELIIRLLQRPPDWEIYSYVLVHLGPQLSNQALVRSCVAQLKMLRNVLCEQVRNASFHEPPAFTSLKKADVAVCLFHVLTVIISYHEYFEKSEEDDIVKSFLQGIVQWDRTSKWCIHALSVCCFELPLSISKSLDSIVQKMSQIITKPATAIHILEFLTSLARLPDLYKNFREDEFKTVFGVCFRYLQHIRDQRDRVAHSTSMQNGARTLRPSGASRDFAALPDTHTTKMRTIEDDMPHYLYSLAYHVITFWFMALKMEDRPKQIPWITKNLYYTDPSGKQIMEEQAEVILDIMSMVAYTDRDQTLRDENFAKPGDGEIWKKTWVVGNSLISIETAARTGLSLVTTRRPVSHTPIPGCGLLTDLSVERAFSQFDHFLLRRHATRYPLP